MPYKEKTVEKIYYSIGEVAELFNVSASLIRFWEQEFDILNPKKNKKGDRFFTLKDMENLKLIHHLVKEKGFTLEGARKQLRGKPVETLDRFGIVDKLKEIKSYLEEIRDNL